MCEHENASMQAFKSVENYNFFQGDIVKNYNFWYVIQKLKLKLFLKTLTIKTKVKCLTKVWEKFQPI